MPFFSPGVTLVSAALPCLLFSPGVIFRKLGQRPSDQQMKVFVHEVDADDSGSLDFEEFSLLMLRLQRAAAAPRWLMGLFEPGIEIEISSPEVSQCRSPCRRASVPPRLSGSPPLRGSPPPHGAAESPPRMSPPPKATRPLPPPPAIVDLSADRAAAAECHIGFDQPLTEALLHTVHASPDSLP